MSIIDYMLIYLKQQDKKLLITTNTEISNFELNVVVVKILSWAKLEYKRSIWIAQGKKNCYKPLDIDMKYTWCKNLYFLVKNEKIFQKYFAINNGKFDFSEMLSEEDKAMERKKAYDNYNPQRNT